MTKKKSVIGRTMLIKGEFESNEEVLIEGTIEGLIRSDGLIIVGNEGTVNADIDAGEVIVQGKVNGNVTGKKKVEIKPAGEVNGNIISQRVVLAEGAVFKGNIDMSVKEEGNQ